MFVTKARLYLTDEDPGVAQRGGSNGTWDCSGVEITEEAILKTAPRPTGSPSSQLRAGASLASKMRPSSRRWVRASNRGPGSGGWGRARVGGGRQGSAGEPVGRVAAAVASRSAPAVPRSQPQISQKSASPFRSPLARILLRRWGDGASVVGLVRRRSTLGRTF